MEQSNSGSDRLINLAHVPPFRLGEVEVHPAIRQLIRGETSETLEPRVMQVLVALAQAKGAVLTRDELTERCWGGRIVGENAINRVISRIRQVASDFGLDSFQLETITKVGYRMIVARTEPAKAPSPIGSEPEAAEKPKSIEGRLDRRAAIAVGLAVSGLGGAGLYFWRRPEAYRPAAAAQELFRLGENAQRQGLPDQARQAIAFFEQAVKSDPQYTDAWGALALSYRHVLENEDDSREQERLAGLIDSAARRALALDPDNADALVARAILKPHYRNWETVEADLRRLLPRFPEHWMLRAQIGRVYYDTGRWIDAVAENRKVLEIDSYLPIAHVSLHLGYWGTGRLQEAESVLDAAQDRWPGHPILWRARYDYLLFNGRPAAAAAYVLNPDTQPTMGSPTMVSNRLTLARAIETREPGPIQASLDIYRKQTLETVVNIPLNAGIFVALGRPDIAFAALEKFYFGTGSFGDPVPPPGRFARRFTSFLFAPPMAPVRNDLRFASLIERIGLDRYWRDTGTAPDYRR